jgi:hypothetical protein
MANWSEEDVPWADEMPQDQDAEKQCSKESAESRQSAVEVSPRIHNG